MDANTKEEAVITSNPDEILVVDDTLDNLELLEEVLGNAGYRVRLAASGELAIRSARRRPPGLILLDIQMPGMSGYEVCELLKAEDTTRATPIIFLSVLDDEDEKCRAFQLGGVDYVSKPVRAAEVLARVGTHLALRRAQQQLEMRNAELKAAGDLLEKRVEDRSNELKQANQKLREQVRGQLELHSKLRESETRLGQIIDFLPDATLAIDREGKVIAWNRAMEQLTGVRAVDENGSGMLGKGDYEYAVPLYGSRRPILADLVIHPVREVEASYAYFKRESGRTIAEGYLQGRDGSQRYMLATAAPLYDTEGGVIGAIQSLRDITARKRNEDAIRIANERFASVLRAATAYSIIAMAPNGTIEVANEGAELMLGYSAAELVDIATPLRFHDWNQIVARAKEQGVQPGLEVLIQRARRGETDTREWTYVRRDRSHLTVSLTVTAMHSDSGDLIGFIGIARDVTSEKRLEQQLLQSGKMESVGLLSGGIAHDFNNLLTPIRGFAEFVRVSLPADDPLVQDVVEIERAAEQAMALTRQLLAFSRKQIIELRSVDLRDVARSAMSILSRTIREDVTIELDLAMSLGRTRADAGQLEAVLVNLAVNAQDAMPEGGVLRIRVADLTLDAARATEDSTLVPGPYVMLSVSDTGVGMDQETMSRVFEPFFTTKEVGKGTGLGLASTYGIIKQHGGSISVESEPGRGSTFTILLPPLASAGESDASTLSEPIVGGSETILVVEDNNAVRSLLDKILPSLGYQVLSAASPDECLALVDVKKESVDLLLTDVVMPGLNGRQLYARLQELYPNLKVLYMSGYTSDVIGHHGVLAEGVHFLHKPFTRSKLSIKVREALAMKEL